jgi:hypothetical protein
MLVSRSAPVALAAAALLPLAGCSVATADAGSPVSSVREVAAATAVVLTTPGELVITVGETPSLEVTAGRAVIDTLTERSADGVLYLEGAGGATPRSGAIRYALTLPVVESVTVEGSGSVRADLAGGQAVTIEVRGSGEVSGENLAAATVVTVVEGSGEVRLAGTSTDQSVEIRGSGGYEGVGLSSATATVDIAGSGDVELTVTGRLKASIAGSGDIRHSGGAKVDGSIAGSGDISAQ